MSISVDEHVFRYLQDAPDELGTEFFALIGDDLQGFIESADDIDVYSLTVTPGHDHVIYMTAANLAGAPDDARVDFAVLDQEGNLVTSSLGLGNSAYAEFPAEAERYYLAAFSEHSAFYEFSVSNSTVLEVSGIGEPLVLGEVHEGSLDFSSDQDRFGILADLDVAYTLSIETALEDLVIALIDGNTGELLGDLPIEAGSSAITFTAPEAGLYTLTLAAAGLTSLGAYTLRLDADTDAIVDPDPNDLAASIDTTGTIAVGDTLAGTIGSDGDVDWYRVTLAGGSYVIDLIGGADPVTGLVDPFFRGVHDATGALIAGTANDDSNFTLDSQASVTLDAGTYYLAAGAYGGATGDYVLSLRATASVIDTTAPRVTAVSPPDGASGVAVGSSIVLTFDETVLRGGGSIQLREGSASGRIVESFDAATSDRLTLNGNQVTIDPTDPLAGDTLHVLTVAPGAFRDSAGNGFAGTTGHVFRTGLAGTIVDSVESDLAASIDTTGTIAVGDTLAGTIGSDGDVDWYRVTLAGGSYVIDLIGGADPVTGLVDPFFRGVHDATGALIAGTANDDSNFTLDSQASVTLDAGTYYLAAGAYGGATGDYVLSLRATASVIDTTAPLVTAVSPPDGASGVAVGSSIVLTFDETVLRGGGSIQLREGSASGRIVESFDAATSDRLTLNGNQVTIDPTDPLAGDTLHVLTVAPGAFRDSAGNGFAGTPGHVFRTGLAGTIVDSVESDLAASIDTTGTIAVGDTLAGTIGSDGDVDWYRVTLAGGSYVIDLIGGADPVTGLVDPFFRGVHDATGALIAGTANDDSNFTLDSQASVTLDAGTYYLAAGAYGGATGDYVLSLRATASVIDTTAPLVTAVSPPDGASGVAVGSSIVLTFDETVLRGGGSIQLREGSASGRIVESFDAATSDRLTLNGNQVTIDPTDPLAGDTLHVLTVAPGAFRDSAGNGFAGTTAHVFRTASIDTASNDITATTATAGTLALGQDVSGAIGIGGDVDWYRVVLGSGSYVVDLMGDPRSGAALADPYFRGVHDSTGMLIADTANDDFGGTLNAQARFTLAAGTYYFAAGAYGSTTGDYVLSLRSDGPTTDSLAPTVTSFSPADGASGVAVSSNIVLTFDEAVSRGTGAIELREASATGRLVERFDVATSPRLTIDAHQLVIDPTDALAGDTSYVVTLAPGAIRDMAGNAHAGTTAYGFRTISMDLAENDFSATTETTGTIAPNADVFGLVGAAGDVDWYRVDLSAGTYVVDLIGDPSAPMALADPYFRGVHDADGALIAGTPNDDYAGALNARSTFTVVDGTYFLAAGAYGDATGSYVMTLRSVATAADDYADSIETTGIVAIGGHATGTVETSNDEDWFRVSLTAGTAYDIALRGQPTSHGSLSDPEIVGIHDASGRMIPGTSNDDFGGSTNSHVTFTPTTTGTYFIAAGAYAFQTGTYRLSLDTAQASDDLPADVTTPITLVAGDAYAGTIGTVGDVDWVRLPVLAGHRYIVDLRGADSANGTLADPQILGIYTANGAALPVTLAPDSLAPASRDSRAWFSTAETADVFVAVRAQDGGTGTYRLSYAEDADTTAPILTSTSPADGSGHVTPSANLSLSFSEAVRAGSGQIILSGGGQTQTIEVTDTARVSFAGSTVTIDPATDLLAATAYTVQFAAGVIEDLAGNAFAGLAATDMDFTTAAPSSLQDRWTIMVYIAGDNDLEPFAIRDLNEMEAVAGLDAAGINVLVQADRAPGYDSSSGNWMDTRRAQIEPDTNLSVVTTLSSTATSIGEANMGAQSTLQSFIDWAAATAPAQRYALVIWDHGAGLPGAAYDDTSGGDRLTVSEIRAAVDASTVETFDIIGFDACLMAMTEVAFSVRDLTHVFVASQELEPGDGWDYTGFLSALRATPGMSDVQLASSIVETYAASYAGQSNITLSAIATDRLGAVDTALDGFVAATLAASAADRALMTSAATAALQFPSDRSFQYRDLVDFMEEIMVRTETPALDTAAQGVIDAVRASVLAKAGSVPEAEGLAIYLPPGNTAIDTSYTPANFGFLNAVAWTDVLALV